MSICEFARGPQRSLGSTRLAGVVDGLTAEKMKDCVWLRPLLVGRFEFLEWTPDNHLRHAKFVAMHGE